MDDQELIRQAMSLLGKRTSPRKKESSRANAKRPRKRKHQNDTTKKHQNEANKNIVLIP